MSELASLMAKADRSDYELTIEDRRKALEKFDGDSLPKLREKLARVKTTKLAAGSDLRGITVMRHQLEWVIKEKEEEERKLESKSWLQTALNNQKGAQGRAPSNQFDGIDDESPPARKGALPLQPVSRPGSLKDSRRSHKEFTPNARMAMGPSGGSGTRQVGQRAPQSGHGQGDTRNMTVPKLKSEAANNRKPAGMGLTRFSNLTASDAGGSSREGTPAESTRKSTRQAAKKEEDAGPIEISSDEEGPSIVGGREPDGQAPQDDRRRSTRSNQYRTTSQKYEGLRGLYPPNGGLEAVQVTPGDLARLDPDEFLNDTVIDFMAKYIQVELAKQPGGEEVRAKFYYFNSFFYKKLTEKTGGEEGMSTPESNHDRVRKWTKGVDIFAKEFLFIPIHDHLHWSLLIVCHPASCVINDGRTACIIHCDSMPSGGHTVAGLCRNVRAYLALEWKRKMGEQDTVAYAWREQNPDAPLPKFTEGNMPHKKPAHVPKQENYCDCGLFMLTYIDFFTFSPPAVVDPKRLQDFEVEHSYPLFLSKKWFSPDNAGNLRRHMRWLILSLFIEQAPPAMQGSPAYMHALVEKVALEDEERKYRGPAAQLAANQKMKAQLVLDRKRKAEREAAEKEAAKALAAEKKADRNARRSGEAGKREGSAEERRVKMAEAAERRKAGELSSSQEEFAVYVDSEEPVQDNLAAPMEDDQAARGPATHQTRSGRKLKRLFREDDGGGVENEDDDSEYSQAALPEEMRGQFRIHQIMDSDNEGNPLMVTVTLLGEKDASGRAEEIETKQFSTTNEALGYMREQWKEQGFGAARQQSDDDCQVLDDTPKKKKAKKQAQPRREDVRQSSAAGEGALKPKVKKRGRGLFSEGRLAELDSALGKKGMAKEVEDLADSDKELIAESDEGDTPKATSKALRGDAVPSSSDDDDFRSPAAGPSGRTTHRQQQQSGSLADLFIGRPTSPLPTSRGRPDLESPRGSASKFQGAMKSMKKGFISTLTNVASQMGVHLGQAGAQDFEEALSDTAGDLEGAKRCADAAKAPAKGYEPTESPPPKAGAAAEPVAESSSDDGRGDTPVLAEEYADRVRQAGAAGPSPRSPGGQGGDALGSSGVSSKKAASGEGQTPLHDAGELGGKQYFGSLGVIRQDTVKRFEASRSGAQRGSHGAVEGVALDVADADPGSSSVSERQVCKPAKASVESGVQEQEDSDYNSHEPHIWEDNHVLPGSPAMPNGEEACSLLDSESGSEESVEPEVGPSGGGVPGVSAKEIKRRSRLSGVEWGLSSPDWTSDGDEGMDNLASRVQEVSNQPTRQKTKWAHGSKRLKSLVALHGGPGRWPNVQKQAKPKAQYAERHEELRTTPSGSLDPEDVGRVDDGASRPSAAIAPVTHQRNDGLDLPCGHLREVHLSPHPPGSPGHVSGLSEDLEAGMEALDLSKAPEDTAASKSLRSRSQSNASPSNLVTRSQDRQPDAACLAPIALSEDDDCDDQLAKPHPNGLGSASAGKPVRSLAHVRESCFSNGAVGASSGGDIKTYSRKRARREGGVKLASPILVQRYEASGGGAGSDADGNSSPVLLADSGRQSLRQKQEAADCELARKLQEEEQMQAEVQAHVQPRFSSRGAQMVSDGDDSDSGRKDPDFRLPVRPARLMPPQSASPSSKRRIRKKDAQPQALEGNQRTIFGCYQ